MTTVSAQTYARHFFEPLDATNKFKCRICMKLLGQDPRKGYSNLMSHLGRQHDSFRALYLESQLAAPGSLDSLSFVSTKAQSLYGWIDLVVNKHLPFSCVDDDKFRRYSSLPPTSTKSLKKVMRQLENLVEDKIAAELPDAFALVFDGWSASGTSFCAIFASFVDESSQVCRRLLAFSPLDNEDDLGADEHNRFVDATLEVFNKTTAAVTCIVGDNCNVNQAMARRLRIPLVGCSSHKFNLAVGLVLEEHETLLTKVHALMTRCRTLINRAKLRRLTHLAPVVRNVTRWSSTYAMTRRYLKLEPFLSEIEDLADHMLSRKEVKDVVELNQHLEDMDSVTKLLQSDDTDMAKVRALFDGVVGEYPIMAQYLAPSARIVQDPVFESAIVKLLQGQDSLLNVDEHAVLLSRGLESVDVAPVGGPVVAVGTSFAQRLLQAKSPDSTIGGGRFYRDVRFVVPTSNMVERLFSKAKLVYTDRRQSLLPINFEMVLFLAVNQCLWDAKLVDEAMSA